MLAILSQAPNNTVSASTICAPHHNSDVLRIRAKIHFDILGLKVWIIAIRIQPAWDFDLFPVEIELDGFNLGLGNGFDAERLATINQAPYVPIVGNFMF